MPVHNFHCICNKDRFVKCNFKDANEWRKKKNTPDTREGGLFRNGKTKINIFSWSIARKIFFAHFRTVWKNYLGILRKSALALGANHISRSFSTPSKKLGFVLSSKLLFAIKLLANIVKTKKNVFNQIFSLVPPLISK